MGSDLRCRQSLLHPRQEDFPCSTLCTVNVSKINLVKPPADTIFLESRHTTPLNEPKQRLEDPCQACYHGELMFEWRVELFTSDERKQHHT